MIALGKALFRFAFPTTVFVLSLIISNVPYLNPVKKRSWLASGTGSGAVTGDFLYFLLLDGNLMIFWLISSV